MYKFKKNSGNACYTLLNFSEAASKIKKICTAEDFSRIVHSKNSSYLQFPQQV